MHANVFFSGGVFRVVLSFVTGAGGQQYRNCLLIGMGLTLSIRDISHQAVGWPPVHMGTGTLDLFVPVQMFLVASKCYLGNKM